MADVTITADPIELVLSARYILSRWPAATRDPDLDSIFYCDYTDVHGNKDAGIPVVTVTVLGTWLNVDLVADPITITLTQLGDYPGTFTIDADAIEIAITIPTGDSDICTQGLKSNWVAWSNIGQMDFTIGRDNVAGERPMDWKGWVYCVKKLGGRVVSYGENGVSLLPPSSVAWGMQTIYRVGLKSKLAVAGDENIHFFIDNKDQLFSLSDGLQKLDYSEYLSVLTSPVLMYEIESGLLYICDGTYGFVYSHADKSLGEGPVNLTGIAPQGGTLYVAAPANITIPAFEICTDIYDLGSRNCKTIQSVEFGTDLDQTLYGSIDHRKNTGDDFLQSPWKEVHENGVLWQTVFGREFRFWLKTEEWEFFELDYIKVNGVRHAN